MSVEIVSESRILYILSAIAVIIVAVQSIIFIARAWKRGSEIGMSQDELKKIATNAAVTSIVPSLPVIISVLTLAQFLGKPFAWFRENVVGSAVYEVLAANIAAQAQGLTGLEDPNITVEVFVIIMFAMTIGIIWGIVFNIFIMPFMDRAAKRAKSSSKGNGAVSAISGALFLAMLATLSVPHVANFERPSGILAFVVAGAVAILLNWLAKRTEWDVLGEFSLPVSMLSGMAAVVIYANFF